MNYEILVKDNPGLCRCCLSEGCYKELATEYTWMNEHEVYADMLLECFDISITQHSEGPNGQNRLICEVCITRLRDACNFKKQVVDSEKKFIDMVAKGHFMPKVVVYEEDPVVKAEMTVEPVPGPSEEDVETEYLEEEMDFEDDEYKPDEDSMDNIEEEEDLTVSPLPVKGKKGKKRAAVVKTEKKTKVAKTKVEAKPSKSTVKELKSMLQDAEKIKTTKRKPSMLRCHVRDVLESSTAVPFRWFSGGFTCLYCPQFHREWADFKNHVEEEHENINLKQILKKVVVRNEVIYLDIYDAICRICDESIDNLNDYIDHLNDRHDYIYQDSYRDAFTPFKMSDSAMGCAYCDEVYDEFKLLKKHVLDVHEDFRKALCDLCGEKFLYVTKSNRHMRDFHQEGSYKCGVCSKSFQSYGKYRYHYVNEHKERDKKCTLCEKMFYNDTERKLHERTAHRLSCFKCDICVKEFTSRTLLKYHRKRHLNILDHECPICQKRFVSITYLNRHMVCHNDEKPFSCRFCGKCFGTKRHLDTHERIHTNDRRYVCTHCGDAFVQSGSLTLHMKKHLKTNQAEESNTDSDAYYAYVK